MRFILVYEIDELLLVKFTCFFLSFCVICRHKSPSNCAVPSYSLHLKAKKPKTNFEIKFCIILELNA